MSDNSGVWSRLKMSAVSDYLVSIAKKNNQNLFFAWMGVTFNTFYSGSSERESGLFVHWNEIRYYEPIISNVLLTEDETNHISTLLDSISMAKENPVIAKLCLFVDEHERDLEEAKISYLDLPIRAENAVKRHGDVLHIDTVYDLVVSIILNMVITRTNEVSLPKIRRCGKNSEAIILERLLTSGFLPSI